MESAVEPLADRPDFVGIGAQKCGTTWLYERLRQHPEIWMPRWKELHFFDWKIHRSRPLGIHLLRPSAGTRRRQLVSDLIKSWRSEDEIPVRTALRYHLGRASLDWYQELFVPGRGKVRGEITPGYATLTPEEIVRANALLAGAKYIFLLRSPIERDWSAAVMGLQQQGTAADSVTLDYLAESVETQAFVVRSDMEQGLRAWLDVVGSERMFVGFLEDIHFNPDAFLTSIFDYLGVSALPGARQEREKVHSRSGSTIPLPAAQFLAHRHLDQIRRLAETYGGYAQLWLAAAEWILEQRDSSTDLPYPLWELPIWETTASNMGIAAGTYLQSRSLG
ncbi:MAG TPA: sulfotransferase [Acidimicrobiia bacterium]|nr:sulfotransferase [Acidimicrobiia bacterium]